VLAIANYGMKENLQNPKNNLLMRRPVTRIKLFAEINKDKVKT
jgi:hypothetical protein